MEALKSIPINVSQRQVANVYESRSITKTCLMNQGDNLLKKIVSIDLAGSKIEPFIARWDIFSNWTKCFACVD